MFLCCYFKRPVTLSTVRELLASAAGELVGAPVHLREVSRQSLPDRNPGDSLAYQAKWEAPGASLVERVTCTDGGNPRDGYGYAMAVDLYVDAPPAHLDLQSGYWEPSPQDASFRIRVGELDAFLRVHGVLAARLDGDRTFAARWPALNNAKSALAVDGDREAARTLLEYALACGVEADAETDWAQETLAELRAELSPAVLPERPAPRIPSAAARESSVGPAAGAS